MALTSRCWRKYRCNKATAKRFFRRMLRSIAVSRTIVTAQLRGYAAAKAYIPDLEHAKRAPIRLHA
ncbi:hypothetical protein SB768_28845 [Burkholderia sp. SIMBA_043]|uniref:hypothetical protein n=1 Tax=Burkholderia TaxID=32008 RepID=UPI0005D943CC|nr:MULTISPECIES: hypothetical protein [Burkholderia cepacia complex]AJY06376.1 transposase domain protein [Burkholderia vietnamiensis LMG 10929]UBI27176.1 hypothetical protein LA325_13240 [Burkholderia vietnamiensis]